MTDSIQSNFVLTLGCLDNIEIFFDSHKYRSSVTLHERAYGVGVYTTKQSRIGHCIFYLTDYLQSNFAFNFEVPR